MTKNYGTSSTAFSSAGLVTGETLGTVTITASGGTAAGDATGSYTLVPSAATGGTVVTGNYEITYANGTLVVGAGSQAITFGAIASKVYGDAPFALGATATSGLPVTYTVVSGPATVGGNTLTITGAGTVAVKASQGGDSSYGSAAEVTQTFTVAKAVPAITWTQPVAIAYGTALSAAQLNATASVPGSFTYSPPSGTVVSAGAQTLSVTFTSADTTNYAGASASVTLTVTKAAATVALGNLNATYDGSAKAASATTTPAGLTVDFTYDGSATMPISAASYAVVGTISSTNYQGSASGTLVIAKAAQTITFGTLAAKTYGAAAYTLGGTASSSLAVTYASSNPAVATVSGSTVTIVGAGTTTITASQAGTSNTNAATSVSQVLTVTKAAATVTLGNLSATYDGSAKAASATTTPAGLTVDFTYDGSATMPISAASYAVVGTISSTNYQGSASGTLVIAKAAQTITFDALAP